MSNIFKRTLGYLIDPSAFVRFQSLATRQMYWHCSRLLKFGEWRARRQLLSHYAKSSTDEEFQIPEQKGFALFESVRAAELTKQATNEAQLAIDSFLKKQQQGLHPKNYLNTVLGPEDITRQSAIFRLATSDVLVSTAGRYIGCLPVLSYVGVWFSPNKKSDKNVGSQLYHLDHEDVRQLKFFIYVDDVDNSSGPTLMIDAASSAELCKRIGYRFNENSKRLDDEIIDDTKVFCAAAKRNSVLAVDTSRCLHAGSRGGDKPRSVIMIQYTTPFAFTAKAYRERGLSHLVDADSRSIEHKLLSYS